MKLLLLEGIKSKGNSELVNWQQPQEKHQRRKLVETQTPEAHGLLIHWDGQHLGLVISKIILMFMWHCKFGKHFKIIHIHRPIIKILHSSITTSIMITAKLFSRALD